MLFPVIGGAASTVFEIVLLALCLLLVVSAALAFVNSKRYPQRRVPTWRDREKVMWHERRIRAQAAEKQAREERAAETDEWGWDAANGRWRWTR